MAGQAAMHNSAFPRPPCPTSSTPPVPSPPVPPPRPDSSADGQIDGGSEKSQAVPPSEQTAAAAKTAHPIGQQPVRGVPCRIPHYSICTGPGSFWRAEQKAVVETFVQDFPSNWGLGQLGGVKVRAQNCTDFALQTQPDGKVLGDDGGSTVRALAIIQERLDAGTLHRDVCCPGLLDTLLNGLMVTPVYYAEEDELSRFAWNAMAHSEENNKYLATTVCDHIRLVHRVRAAMVGNDKAANDEESYALVRDYFVNLYGPGKRRTVSRWIVAAQKVADTVISMWADRILKKGLKHGLRDGYIFDNPFLLPNPAQRELLLTDAGKLAATQQLFNELDGGKSVTVNCFRTKICTAVQAMCSWMKHHEKKYKRCGADDENKLWKELKDSIAHDVGLLHNAYRVILAEKSLHDDREGLDICIRLRAGFLNRAEATKREAAAEREAAAQQKEAEARAIEQEAAEQTRKLLQDALEEQKMSEDKLNRDQAAIKAQAVARARQAREAGKDTGAGAEEEDEEDGPFIPVVVDGEVAERDDAEDVPATSISRQAARLNICRARARAAVDGFSVRRDFDGLAAIVQDIATRLGTAHVIQVLLDGGSCSTAVIDEQIGAVGAAFSRLGENSMPSCRIYVLCGNTPSSMNIAWNSMVVNLGGKASIFYTTLASNTSRAVSISRPSRINVREGRDEFCVSAIMPPPTSGRAAGQRKARRKTTQPGTISVPFFCQVFPKRNKHDDLVHLACRGDCGFFADKAIDEVGRVIK